MKKFGRLASFWSTVFCCLVALGIGCSSEDPASKDSKTSGDVAVEEDVQTATDTNQGDLKDAETDDSGIVEKDVAADVEQEDVKEGSDAEDDAQTSDTADDVLEDVLDDTEDTAPDTDIQDDVNNEPDAAGGDDEYEGRPLGQCNDNSDCEIMAGGYRDCRANVPGGVCGGCGLGQCGVTEICVSGACQEECTTNEHCAPGLTCKVVEDGKACGVERCVNDVCPTPMFGCSGSGFCQRIACEKQDDCPESTTCTHGLCIENRQL